MKAINARGVTILMVEQKARQCLALADYGYVLDRAQPVRRAASGSPRQDPEVTPASYLARVVQRASGKKLHESDRG